jgi:hypothetical protein
MVKEGKAVKAVKAVKSVKSVLTNPDGSAKILDTSQAIEEPHITMQYNIIQGMEINITEIYDCNQSTNQFIVGNSEGRILMAVVIEIDTTSHEWRNPDKISVILDAIEEYRQDVKTPVEIDGYVVYVTPVPVPGGRGKINMKSRKNKNRHSIKKNQVMNS